MLAGQAQALTVARTRGTATKSLSLLGEPLEYRPAGEQVANASVSGIPSSLQLPRASSLVQKSVESR